MGSLDWWVMCLTFLVIILYGVYKSRGQRDVDSYFLDNKSMPWYLILFSIIGTQASAVTFLSAPGQAYTDGMRFVQYYFGLPIAMIVICIAFVPLFHRLKVYTAYQFLEDRFDLKTRSLTAFLFLLQRGMSTGISIYAPAIIVSSILGWNIYWTNIFMGGFLIIYTVLGGTKAVAHTQKLQLFIIIAGMFLAGYMVVHLLPEGVSFSDALHIAGKSGKLNVITTPTNITEHSFWQDKYTLWSGLIGGFFLALSYFGTDQSQVGRYLTAKSIKESRMGLLLNGLVKVPMQFLILLIGALLFAFYQFQPAPLSFNEMQLQKVTDPVLAGRLEGVQERFNQVSAQKQALTMHLVDALHQKEASKGKGVQNIAASREKLSQLQNQADLLRGEAKEIIKTADPAADTNDTNYIFLNFVIHYLPKGLIGLLFAIIFLAAWGSIAAALNSLASTTVIDIYKRSIRPEAPERHYLNVSRWFTLFWGVFCIAVAQFAGKLGSLIEAVNVLGSLFYGTILGIFMVAFFQKSIRGAAAFWSAVLTELIIILIYNLDVVSFLWLNAIGCLLTMILAYVMQWLLPGGQKKAVKANPD
ncbi:transporter, SSS family [Arachidicoccus rhizosphaerae]|uniref:Transporter, SSS family n=1 Tax=Arachidicoccus rhizosphaerae TaxID=551991 RepID=A0A1H3YDT0_9BACT|nr:sodium:solute symporter [Arachidicoccus rhizosphaerae]SEA09653.1 transporter, SSS family [Arachidicoccus rhizosphaerae]